MLSRPDVDPCSSPVTGWAAKACHPGSGFSFERDPIGHAVKPAAQRVAFANRGGLVQQHKKRGLESVVAIRLLVQKTLAHAADHRPMAADQFGKSFLVLLV